MAAIRPRGFRFGDRIGIIPIANKTKRPCDGGVQLSVAAISNSMDRLEVAEASASWKKMVGSKLSLNYNVICPK